MGLLRLRSREARIFRRRFAERLGERLRRVGIWADARLFESPL
jgi:hypothetical protein